VEVLRPPDPRLARRAVPGRGDDGPGVGHRRTDTATPGQRVLRWALQARRFHRREKRVRRRNLQGLAKQKRKNRYQNLIIA
jgi:hypothetical protein